MQEIQVPSLGWEDPLEKEMATHSSILAWKIPWTEEPGPWGRKRVRRDLATKPLPPLPQFLKDELVLFYWSQPVAKLLQEILIQAWAQDFQPKAWDSEAPWGALPTLRTVTPV